MKKCGTQLIIGEGRLYVSTIHGEGKHGLLIRPIEEAHAVNSKDPTIKAGDPANISDGDIVIWASNFEGVLVLQQAVNELCLWMNGFEVTDNGA